METRSAASGRRPPVRLRLPAQVRTRQILDAALAVFCERGYAAARMDDIAAAAGLSKGGLYAHFASKDEVFEALLSRLLAPPALVPPPQPWEPAHWVDWLLDALYDHFAEPGLRAGLRLLVPESERVPALVAQWHGQVVQPYVEALGALLAQGLPAGRDGRPPLLAREPWLVLAPAVQGLLMQTVLPPGLAHGDARLRSAHRDLLLALMTTDARPA